MVGRGLAGGLGGSRSPAKRVIGWEGRGHHDRGVRRRPGLRRALRRAPLGRSPSSTRSRVWSPAPTASCTSRVATLDGELTAWVYVFKRVRGWACRRSGISTRSPTSRPRRAGCPRRTTSRRPAGPPRRGTTRWNEAHRVGPEAGPSHSSPLARIQSGVRGRPPSARRARRAQARRRWQVAEAGERRRPAVGDRRAPRPPARTAAPATGDSPAARKAIRAAPARSFAEAGRGVRATSSGRLPGRYRHGPAQGGEERQARGIGGVDDPAAQVGEGGSAPRAPANSSPPQRPTQGRARSPASIGTGMTLRAESRASRTASGATRPRAAVATRRPRRPPRGARRGRRPRNAPPGDTEFPGPRRRVTRRPRPRGVPSVSTGAAARLGDLLGRPRANYD